MVAGSKVQDYFLLLLQVITNVMRNARESLLQLERMFGSLDGGEGRILRTEVVFPAVASESAIR